MVVTGVAQNTYQTPFPAVKENLRASTTASADAMIAGKVVSDKMVQIALTYQIVSELQNVDSQSSEKHLRRLLQQVLATPSEPRPISPSQQSEMLNSLIAASAAPAMPSEAVNPRERLDNSGVYQAAGQIASESSLGSLVSLRA